MPTKTTAKPPKHPSPGMKEKARYKKNAARRAAAAPKAPAKTKLQTASNPWEYLLQAFNPFD